MDQIGQIFLGGWTGADFQKISISEAPKKPTIWWIELEKKQNCLFSIMGVF